MLVEAIRTVHAISRGSRHLVNSISNDDDDCLGCDIEWFVRNVLMVQRNCS